MLSTWGTPAWNRIKSYNFPDRYVRHAGNVARIDAYPFDPYQDQQWTIVPGLADPAGISLRSVNFPDRYLRHANYALVLNANDGIYQRSGGSQLVLAVKEAGDGYAATFDVAVQRT